MKAKEILLYLPAAMSNSEPTGGQVIASRGLVEFVEKKSLNYTLIDHGNAARRGGLISKFWLLWNVLRLSIVSLFGSYRAYLCFYSSYFGLYLRFIPAIILYAKGCNTAIFFRNTDIYRYKGAKLKLAKILLAPYKTYFVQGSNLKRYLETIGVAAESIVVIPNWLSPNFKALSVRRYKGNRPLSFVFASKLTVTKGIYSLLEALVGNANPKIFTLDVYGWGDEYERCSNFIRDAGLEKVVVMRGEVPHDKILATLAEYDVYILPTYSEGFPNAVLEAFCAGLPVIASDAGEITDIVQDGINGFIIDPLSPDSIYAAMLKYIENPDLIAAHSANTTCVVNDNHDWETNCGLLIEIMLGKRT